jgi:hypothetical protein
MDSFENVYTSGVCGTRLFDTRRGKRIKVNGKIAYNNSAATLRRGESWQVRSFHLFPELFKSCVLQTKWKYSSVNCVMNKPHYCGKCLIAQATNYMFEVKLVAASSNVSSRKKSYNFLSPC